jgi:hypothetical protein
VKRLLFPLLERLFEFIAKHAENTRQYFAICPDCGENRYTGKGCIVH